jgi:hypothetical protein
MRMLLRQVQLASLQRRIPCGCLLQLENRMLTFHQKMAEFLAISFLVQLLDIVEFHWPRI